MRDELPLCSLPEAALQLRLLFETAVDDYLCKDLLYFNCYEARQSRLPLAILAIRTKFTKFNTKAQINADKI